MTSASPFPVAPSLDDKWTVRRGRIVINGTQAIARTLLDQKWLDIQAGLHTAGYITGYRGSPLGGVDSLLWSIEPKLAEAELVFQPGVNEDIAATAVRGTQQIDAVPGAKYDGVFAAWYGKGPGVDRSGDAFKHGNYAGAHRNGGVLLFYGDDHAAKSSTVAHHSEQAVSASMIPSLYPSDAGEIRRFGLLGFALSRYSGSWVGIKCVTEVVEQSLSVDIDLPGFAPVLPPVAPDRAALYGLHGGRTQYDPLGDERIVVEERLPLVEAFVRANDIDRVVIEATDRRVGIVTAGKSYGDVRAALLQLGLDDAACARAGISLYKVGCIWPLEPYGLRAFARGHKLLFVVEEKAAFVEPQIASLLINAEHRPAIIGKRDIDGTSLVSSVQPLDPRELARAIQTVLMQQGIAVPLPVRAAIPAVPVSAKRSPYFCSGCPHNRSTRIPDGSLSLTGIGCHTMVNFVRPEEALLPTQMGGEGGNWIGLAPFTETPHIFQNLGDGTYYHSGLLAIRAAVAARVNITYKILYNDAVAMTGGQPIDGPISVATMVQQVLHEGVANVTILSDEPAKYADDRTIPPTVRILHRDRLDDVQRELRRTSGCTILIYEQTCAAEKRRRRKRGQMPDPPQRVFIAADVCEGCGDCSALSTCVSITPRETAFGRKRAIDQSSCNKDFSCSDGFCPSFITIHGAEPRRRVSGHLDPALFAALPDAPVALIASGAFNIMIAGIGGTGVVTVGAVIGMAAHIDGLAISGFDMTGLSQKNGAVFSHLRIARDPASFTTARLGAGEADTLLAFDLLAALAPESLHSLSPVRTRAVANADLVSGVDFQFDRDAAMDETALLARARQSMLPDGLTTLRAKQIAENLLGDAIGANMLLVGAAAQAGMLPVGVAALEQAIQLNNVAVPLNLDAFRLGRLLIADPDTAHALMVPPSDVALPITLDEVIAHRVAHLEAYQDAALRDRYLALVDRVRMFDPNGPLAMAVARNYAKLLAYKDEYEVARLLTRPELMREIEQAFDQGGRIAFNLAPPLLARRGPGGRPKKRAFSRRIVPLLRLLARLKRVRGTWLDPFAHTAERRAERALIEHYEGLVDRVLSTIDSIGFGRAVALLDLADDVRGYGPVKKAAIAKYRAAVDEALASPAHRAPEPAGPRSARSNASAEAEAPGLQVAV